jgi:serine/threonine protein kinase
MELIRGQNLEKFAIERGRLDAGYAALICLHLCRGLALVHSKGLVHRDIKASNVMRQEDGRIVVVDFGLGRKADPENESRRSTPAAHRRIRETGGRRRDGTGCETTPPEWPRRGRCGDRRGCRRGGLRRRVERGGA